jgi:hypothetical protein
MNTKFQLTLLFIILFSIYSNHGFSQFRQTNPRQSRSNPQDKLERSPDSARVYYFIASIDSLSLGKFHHIDTTLTYFHQYDASQQNYMYYAGRGNIGLHSKGLIYHPNFTEGFNYAKSYLDLYTYKNEEIKYYKTVKPYTETFYVTGAGKEQTLEVVHSQNVGERLNIGIKFRFLNSNGIYQNQESDIKNLCVTFRYTTDNNRYGFIVNYRRNKFVTEENGGIKDEANFINNQYSNRKQMPVNLTNAKNTSITSGIFFNHYFNIGRAPIIKNDSITTIVHDSTINSNDTTVIEVKRKGFKFGRITHSLLLERSKIYYSDNSAVNSFYSSFDIPLSNSAIFDSTFVYNLENQFRWSNLDISDTPKKKSIYFYLGLKHKFVNVNDISQQTTINQLIPNAGFSLLIFKGSKFKANGYFVIGDHNGGDLSLDASLDQHLIIKNKDWGQLRLKAKYSMKSPDWFLTYYNGNILRWNNPDFNKESILQFQLNYTNKNIFFSTTFNNIKNHLYFDNTAHPKQHEPSIFLISANLRYNKNYKKWNVDLDLHYQKGVQNVINIPEFIGNITVTYTKQIRHIAKLQPGFEILYNSSYFADAYMPAIRSFYVQSNRLLGNHFYADVFLNVIIKRTTFFLKYQHINSKMKFDYIMTPGYPMQDISLKFGLSWKFYD